MTRILGIICFTLLASNLFGQSQWIRFSVLGKDIPCEEVPKQVIITTKIAGKDSVLLKEPFKDCQQLIEIPKVEGLYAFTIKTQSYQPILLSFEIKADSPDTIQLGEMALKETISELDEVTITGIQRKFIEIDADKTTLTVKDNPVLSISSIYDAILKSSGNYALSGRWICGGWTNGYGLF
jgi:hypothetical protein